jgi:hypothetical protein
MHSQILRFCQMTTTAHYVAVRERMHFLITDSETREQDEEIFVLYKADGSKKVNAQKTRYLAMHYLHLYATTPIACNHFNRLLGARPQDCSGSLAYRQSERQQSLNGDSIVA